MKGRMLKSLRTKIVLTVAACGVLSLISLMILNGLAQALHTKPFFHEILSILSDSLGIEATMFLTGVLLFITLLYLLTRRHIQYLQNIVKTIHGMESGNLDLRADIQSEDELGDLAAAVNKMAEKLKISLIEERNAEAAKKDLITSISHDLRTPLTSVIGFLGLLVNRGVHTEEELEKYASIAHKKALKLQELIDELFEYTRVSYSNLKANRTRINLTELVEQLLEEFYPQLEANRLQARLSALQEKLYIHADGDLIARMFENLLANAVRYGWKGGFIDVKVHSEGANALVDITNYGDIIPAKYLDKIFEKFYRADPSRSRETGGTGLGLAIASSIVQMHGGGITAASGEEGTRFRVSLPVAR